jgi:hypothetical protein
MRLGRKLAAGVVVESVAEPVSEPNPDSAAEADELDRAAVRVEGASREQPVELTEQSAGR